jgi:hypothetical protein
MLKNLLISLLLFTLSGCALGYGPAVDNSKFISAKLAEDGKSVVFTCQRIIYRPASGWRAFPDGGIPNYVIDEDIIGIIGLDVRGISIISKERNKEWQDGQGQFFVSHANGRKAVITQSGQGRNDYLTRTRLFMLDISTSVLTPLMLKEDFENMGRDVGYFYMLDEDGTLLFINRPTGSSSKEKAEEELWLRYPAGEYLKVASGSDYYGLDGRNLIYWSLNENKLFSFSIDSRVVEEKPRNFYPHAETEKVFDVRVTSDGKSLELWEKDSGSGWHLSETLINLSEIK